MTATIRLFTPMTPEAREAIITPLLEHNHWHGLGLEGEEVAWALESDQGEIAGGLLGYWRDRWLFVASLSTRTDLRGQGLGRALMARMEEWVRAEGGVGVWLDSYGFQAAEFYRHLGYIEMGRLPEYLPGVDRIWFVKRLAERVLPEP